MPLSKEANRLRMARRYAATRVMTPLERALFGRQDPYTPEERAEVEAIRGAVVELEARAERLNASLKERLGEDNPLNAVLEGRRQTVLLAPF